jgi:hypothetical protein
MDDGRSHHGKIAQRELGNDAAYHEKIKFSSQIGDEEIGEIISYNELSSIVDEQPERQLETSNTILVFKEIRSHQGPLPSAHNDYKGSSYSFLFELEIGSETDEPLDIIIKDDPVSVADYAFEHNVLETPG